MRKPSPGPARSRARRPALTAARKARAGRSSTRKTRGLRIGVLTGGGDAPGLNAVIRGLVVTAADLGHEVVGLLDGWAGMLPKGKARRLALRDVENLQAVGGTILGSSRTNPYKRPDGEALVKAAWKRHKLDALVACGGDDTLGVASKLFKAGFHMVGVPKTIDNDLDATDVTFGFDTSINISMEALDRLHTTARSHHRVLVVEIMGRYAGWLTAYAGMAGGAHVVILPEEPFDMDAICDVIRGRRKGGQGYSIVAISEGARPKTRGEFITQDDKVDEFGHVKLGGISKRLAEVIEKRTGQETRYVVLGHLQRGGPPSAADRVLGLRLGGRAAQMVDGGHFGKMVSVKGTELTEVALSKATGKQRLVPQAFREEIRRYWG